MKKKGQNSITYAEPEHIILGEHESFRTERFRHAFFTRLMHYHPEVELLLVTKGYGVRMVGDHFERFEEGDLVLVGSNLPHAWISDLQFFKPESTGFCESVYVQFKKSIFGIQFIDIPELRNIRTVLSKAERGIKIMGKYKESISKKLLLMSEQRPIEQLLTLIHLLDMIQYCDIEMLASKDYISQSKFKSPKMMTIQTFIMQHFKEEIDLAACARQVNMSPTSFCRFFKKSTEVTFSVFLNHLRINFAQQLLANTELPIKEIAFDSGYTSIAYFNQKFKQLTGVSPNEFRKQKK